MKTIENAIGDFRTDMDNEVLFKITMNTWPQVSVMIHGDNNLGIIMDMFPGRSEIENKTHII